MPSKLSLFQLGGELPDQKPPFAVFLNADDPAWADDGFRALWIRKLLDAGGRYFVCFGAQSEVLHDHIDDAVVSGNYEDVMTTFHEDESPKDVADFFRHVAAAGMEAALVLVADMSKWIEVFDDVEPAE